MEWSYRLLDERERRVFRAVSAFPGPFTLEGAEAVAGAGAGPAVLHLVDCSLLVPLLARCLSGRSATLLGIGRIAEAAGDARRALTLARDGGHPAAEALALAVLSLVACVSGDRVGAVQLARQAERISAGLDGPAARACGHTLTTVLIQVGDLAAAERACAAGLAGARDAGDLWSLGNLLEKMVVLDLGSGRYADAASHLREALQTAMRTGVRRKALEDLDCCGYLCARTGRGARRCG